MRRAIAAIAIALVLAAGCGRGALLAGPLVAASGVALIATAEPDTNSCEGQSHCIELDLNFREPAGAMLMVLGGAIFLGGLIGAGLDGQDAAEREARLEEAARVEAEQRRANGEWRPPATEPAPPPAPAPLPPRWTVVGTSRESGTWRDVPPVPGDDAP
jgi:hypothetical protein